MTQTASTHLSSQADLTALMGSRPGQAPVTTTLVAVNLAVFVLMLLAGAGLWHTSTTVPLAWGASFGPATQDGQWWRLFTAMFVHFGLVHLGLNLWALWDVGRLVERIYGRPRFVLLYVASGVVGNLLSLVQQGNQAVSGGASGAIFSLYGALLVFLWRERQQVDRREFRWLFGGAAAFTLLTLGMGQLVSGIDNAAHGGGLVAGALMGTLLARRWTPASPSVERGRWLAGVALVAGVAGLLTHMSAPSYLMGDEVRAREAIRRFLLEDQRISLQWGRMLSQPPATLGTTFEGLAGRIETDVGDGYAHSFEQLAAANPGAGAPSAKTLQALQNYASVRANAARDMADGLRSKDLGKVQKAIRQAKTARPNPLTEPPLVSPAAPSPSLPSSAPLPTQP